MDKNFNEKIGTPLWLILVQLIILIVLYIYNTNNEYLYAGGVILTISLLKLKIKITDNYIEYKIFPLIKRKIYLKDIQALEISELNAMSDFLGWGIRYSKKLGWGYIFFTENAIYIKSKSIKRVLSLKNKKNLITFLNDNPSLQKIDSNVYKPKLKNE